MRTLTVERWQVAVFGSCLAGDEELHTALRQAARTGVWERLARLPGSFVTIRIGPDGVLAVPDLAGAWPVFFTSGAGGIAYSSSPLPLVDLIGAAPDPRWLAARLFTPDIPQATTDRSAFAAIGRSRPGHMLLLDGSGLRQQPISLPVGGLPFEAGAEQLKDALLTATGVRAARAERLSSDLSGGLDSSSLALLAARHRSTPLPAITYVDPISGGQDDLAYAHLCAAAEPGLDHIVLSPGPDALPLAGLEHAPLLDEPSQDALFWARDQSLLAPAAGGLHMTGDGGDCVLTGPLAYLADLARPATMKRFVRESAAWARLRHRPAHAVIRAALHMARTTYPQALAAVVCHLRSGDVPARRGVEDALRWCAPGPATAWANRHARLDLAGQLACLADTGHDRPYDADAEALRLVHEAGASSRLFAQMAAGFGVDVDTPYLDNQVIMACSAVPVIERTTTRALKPLLSAALTGLIPPALLARTTKGSFTACLYAGLRHAAPYLRELLDSSRLADLGLLQAAPTRKALDLLLHGANGPVAAMCDVLAAEVWLRSLERPRAPLWSPVSSMPTPRKLDHACPTRP
ncbi:albusnodin/ikarugamycin family macrolactam cyclase [Nonomuraea sp. GTA35]|uniref:albusnodin/ikarugamycin family macrolactam cyclase n=1 Tax=Nonomuraea sp. GTA35 TaxID=1676746 RepID=UPI0035BFFB6F